jgi:hypothetical protein
MENENELRERTEQRERELQQLQARERQRREQQEAIELQMNTHEGALGILAGQLNAIHNQFDRKLVELRRNVTVTKNYLNERMREGTISNLGNLQAQFLASTSFLIVRFVFFRARNTPQSG